MTRAGKFRTALGAGSGLSIGTWIKLPATESVEMAAAAGFDFVVIDLEHSPMNLETAFRHIGAALSANISPIVRVATLDGGVVSRILDAGADGVMIPHVDTVADAEAAVSAVRFPPIGERGMGPTSRAGDWGLMPYAEYVRFGQEEAALIVQIESELGVHNAGEIAAIVGVDALLIGSTDLAASAGLPPAGPEMATLMATAVTASRAAGTPIGNAGAATAEAAQDALDRRFAFSVMSNDATLLASSLRAAAAAGRSATIHRDNDEGKTTR